MNRGLELAGGGVSLRDGRPAGLSGIENDGATGINIAKEKAAPRT
jgi:hypothetical protein